MQLHGCTQGPWSPTCLPQALYPRSPVILHLCGHPPAAEKLRAALLPPVPALSEPGQGESPLGALAVARSITSGISKAAEHDPPRPKSRPSHVFPTTLRAIDAVSLRERCCGHVASCKAVTLLLSPRGAPCDSPAPPGAQGAQCGGHTSPTNRKVQGTVSSGISLVLRAKPPPFSPHMSCNQRRKLFHFDTRAP